MKDEYTQNYSTSISGELQDATVFGAPYPFISLSYWTDSQDVLLGLQAAQLWISENWKLEFLIVNVVNYG